ncbi:MAG: endonuclease/exonuclease/phosphatase family protein [Prevotellaceae bacterium]|jgi:endonuclease/exonuclease/phosphatase family metal-dependent hydrolase|nr:endonuclease/exonuclease/phosphatase family protein [Prevotellaceae bacterium]
MKRAAIFVLLCALAHVLAVSCRTDGAKNTIRVMTYNVRNCSGLDGVTDYRRIAGVIAGLAPDVAALQELDSVTGRSRQVDVLLRLSELTQLYPVYGASILYDGGKYGVGVLSKQPPLSWKRIPLPGREELRSLLLVELEGYVFCCTHFSLTEEDCIASIPLVEEALRAYRKPAILAGDINATPGSPVLEAFRKSWKLLSDTAQHTFPADKPKETIDYLFGYLPGKFTYTVQQAQVASEPEASDHRPVFAEVSLQ